MYIMCWCIAILSLHLPYGYDVRQSQWNLDLTCYVLDCWNLVLLTPPLNTLVALSLPFSPLSQHYCIFCQSRCQHVYRKWHFFAKNIGSEHFVVLCTRTALSDELMYPFINTIFNVSDVLIWIDIKQDNILHY